VQQDGHVVGARALQQIVAQARLRLQALAAPARQLGEGQHALGLVARQAARVVVDDPLQARVLRARDELVHLLLVLGDGQAHALALQLAQQLLGREVGVGGRGHGAQRDRAQHAEVKRRPVVAHHQHLLVRRDAQLLQPAAVASTCSR
jgi:hypothetical protein